MGPGPSAPPRRVPTVAGSGGGDGSALTASLAIGVGPTLHLGPAALGWHGVFAALGALVGASVAWLLAPTAGLARWPLESTAIVVVVAAVVGARIWYLAENAPSDLLTPWTAGRSGFSMWGGVLLGGAAAAGYLRLIRQPVAAYLDVVALGFLAGAGVGRVGDLLNGEHIGPPTDLPWGVRYVAQGAEVPQLGVSYHSGALYEMAAAVVLLASGLALMRRPRPAGALALTLLAAFAGARVVVFTVVRDVPVVALGLRQAQLTGIAVAVLALAWLLALQREAREPGVVGASDARRALLRTRRRGR